MHRIAKALAAHALVRVDLLAGTVGVFPQAVPADGVIAFTGGPGRGPTSALPTIEASDDGTHLIVVVRSILTSGPSPGRSPASVLALYQSGRPHPA